ncbi:hypothetical protein CBS101457_003090 [Exobasidium rhododendri]|nr:hypothetical protein CBS101457_003090 [Exobasidium rhododendri]
MWPTADAFAIKSHAMVLMQTLQSLTPDVAPQPSTSPSISTRSSSIGRPEVSPKSSFNSMAPPMTPSMTRSAQRSRAAAAAAVAAANGKTSHVRTPSNATGLGDVARKRIDTMSRLVIAMGKSARLRYELPVEELGACIFPCLADQAGKEVRAAAYRVLRHAMVRPPWKLVRVCRIYGLDLYLSRTFLRDSRFDLEKEQALKLCRTIMDHGSNNIEGEEELISISVIRALISAADSTEEKLRYLYIETLAELAVHDTELLIKGGGLRTVLQTLTDGPYELAPTIASLLLTLVDLPGTRKYFRPGFDLEVALSSFTEAREDEASLRSTSQVVSIMLRSWSGLFYLSLYDRRSIKSLILALRANSSQIQDKILDVFSSLLSIKGKSGDAKKTTVATTTTTSGTQRFKSPALISGNDQFNLYDHYLALIVVTLIECGLVEAIVHVLENSIDLSRKATLLMGQITQLASRHLPSDYGIRVHALPDLFRAMFIKPGDRERADCSNKMNKAALALRTLGGFERETVRNQVLLKNAKRNRSHSGTVSARAATQVDDLALRAMLAESNALSAKDYTKWNIDVLIHIFEAIAGNPKRLEETIRSSKIIKRVLAFYHPFTLQYAAVPNNVKTQRYTKLGCVMLSTLLSYPDGIRTLAEDKLLKEIRESLETDMISSTRTHDTLTIGYFEMLGVLTKSSQGLQMMHKARVFSALYRAMEERDEEREGMVQAILQHFDLTMEGHCRVLLSKILTSTGPKTRRQATLKIAEMIRASPSRWLVRLLVTQLYDASIEVREVASDLLFEVCTSSTKALEMVVSMRPMLEEASHSLLLKFISTSIGMHYLMQGDFIDKEMDDWFNNRNHLYTVQLEVLLERGFHTNRLEDDQQLQWDGRVPPHFYGELTKTPEGCAILYEKGHFAEFAHFIRTHGDEEEDVEIINKVKSTLWAVGNIGANEGGLPFLEQEDTIANIVEIAHTSPCLSLRGTCYFVLGLLSTTRQGSELIEDQGWLCASADESIQYCVPPNDFLQLQAWKPVVPSSKIVIPLADTRIERKIVLNVSNLCNTILANKASRKLAKLKKKHGRLFLKKGIELFVRCVFIVNFHYLRQPVRRFIWELFEMKLDQASVRQFYEAKTRLQIDGTTEQHQHPKSKRAMSTVSTSTEIEPRRQGDEVLVYEEDVMDDEEEGEDDDEEEEEEDDDDDEDDSEGEEVMEEDGQNRDSSSQQGQHRHPSLGRFDRKRTMSKPAGMSLASAHNAAFAPRKKVIGGFTLAEGVRAT